MFWTVPPGLSTLVGLSEQFRRGLLSEDTGDPTSRARRPRPDAELGAAWARRKRIAGERNGIPAWANWNSDFGRRYTVGVEEEAMLLDAGDLRLRQCGDAVLSRLSGEMFDHTGLETHAGVLERRTGVHSSVTDAIRELGALRARLAAAIGELGLRGACAGTYPSASVEETRISGARRYRALAQSMRALARRSVTMALHVHVGVPDPEDATRLLHGLRDRMPVLLALSANSPFCDGRDTGFASARTVIFQAFPRTGIPRMFADYAEYVRAVDLLIRSGALADPSYLWWDVRLQPALGTVEVRVMDAQTYLRDTAALVAVVLALAHMVLESEGMASAGPPEVLAENRFLAARDGIGAAADRRADGTARAGRLRDSIDAYALPPVCRAARMRRGAASSQRACLCQWRRAPASVLRLGRPERRGRDAH